MGAFAVLAIHKLKPGVRDGWARLAMVNARAARAEPGCLQFDVVLSTEEPDTAFLVEMYRDRAAWDEHFRQPWCQDFMAAIKPMLSERVRLLGDRVEP